MITVVDYDPAWPERFEALRLEYADAMADADVPRGRAVLDALDHRLPDWVEAQWGERCVTRVG